MKLNRAQKARHGNIFINFRPMDTMATPDEAPVLPLCGRRLQQERKPGQRCRQFAPIRQRDDQTVVRHRDIDSDRIKFNG